MYVPRALSLLWFHLLQNVNMWTRHVIPFTTKHDSEKYYWLQNATSYTISKSIHASCYQWSIIDFKKHDSIQDSIDG
jgi:hypothetical protein